jgi:hypothetical protein
MIALLLSVVLTGEAGDTLPLVDISGDASRHVVIAAGTDRVYQGHPTTVLMPDGKTIYCVWTIGHGGRCGPMAKSLDGGLTWHPMATPKDWQITENCPSIYLLQGRDGIQRLMVFAAVPKMSQTFSEDGGRTWSKVRGLGMPCVMAFSSITRLSSGDYLGLYHRGRNDLDVAPLTIWQSISKDGGLSWGKPTLAGELAGRSPCEPEVIRSPDGKQLLCLMRENQRIGHSLRMVSNDEGHSWSKPTETPWGLTGDRHKARCAQDGRLVVCFRDMAPGSPCRGSFVAWVGTYADILAGKPGQCRVKILHQHGDGGWSRYDCGYPGLELLPDGTFVATTYVKYRPGPEKNSVVSVRFRLNEIDAARLSSAEPREVSRVQSLDGQ